MPLPAHEYGEHATGVAAGQLPLALRQEAAGVNTFVAALQVSAAHWPVGYWQAPVTPQAFAALQTPGLAAAAQGLLEQQSPMQSPDEHSAFELQVLPDPVGAHAPDSLQ